jgi:AraC-like DNA-binding protein
MAGIGLAYFLCFLLITKKGKSPADQILAVWLFIIAVHLSLFYLRITFQLPQFLGIEIPLPMLHGPFLYIYTTALTTNSALRNNSYFIHFVPAIVCYLYMIQYFILPTEQKIFIEQNKGKGFDAFILIKFIAIAISGLAYVTASEIALRRHTKTILSEFSATEKINLNWLRYLIYGIGLIWVLVVLPNEKLLFSAAVLFVFVIGYFGIRQVGIFTSAAIATTTPEITEPIPVLEEVVLEKPKYQKSGLTPDVAYSLKQKLARVMENEKLYTQSELTLSDLAARLETLPNHLSQLLNDVEGKNFYDYINTLRIEEFKRLVATPESSRFTLMGLATSSGFSSKSSFNRYFKKVTGVAPSEYLKTISTLHSQN